MSANREYKSSVFSLLFSEPDILRELYGALKGVVLPPDTPVVVNTLEGSLFRNMLNDISFAIGDKEVVVVEHQSSVNPNMPLRILMYIARLYEKMTAGRKAFGGKQVKIPRPEFIVLYNGAKPYPDEDTLRLSDAFADASSAGTGKDTPPDLELVVKVYNINKGHNAGKLRQSQTLRGYNEFIGKVRELERPDEELTEAIRKAIKWCISHNILKDFLEQNGSEVINMLFNEFDMEAELAAEWEAGVEIGVEIGMEKGVGIGMEKGVGIGIEKGVGIGMEKAARNALAKGLPVEMIREITGLDLETLSQLSSQ